MTKRFGMGNKKVIKANKVKIDLIKLTPRPSIKSENIFVSSCTRCAAPSVNLSFCQLR